MTFTDRYPQLLADCRTLARRIVHDGDLADQLSAEALLRLYEHREQLTERDPEYQRAWALRVTHNLAVDEIQRRARDCPLDDAEVEVTDRTSESLLRMIMLAALADLPPGQRRSIELRYLQDLSQSDTAQVLGITVGTVATHVSRGFTALRRQLADSEPHPNREEPSMKINTISHAKQLIGTDTTVTTHLLNPIRKDQIAADIGIPAVYRHRGQAPRVGTDTAEIECLVIDMYDDQRPLITDLPSRTLLASARRRLNRLRPGYRATGRVTTIVPLGAFVEFDGLRGLIHRSELHDRLVSNQPIEVEVTAVDANLDRIGLRPVD